MRNNSAITRFMHWFYKYTYLIVINLAMFCYLCGTRPMPWTRLMKYRFIIKRKPQRILWNQYTADFLLNDIFYDIDAHRNSFQMNINNTWHGICMSRWPKNQWSILIFTIRVPFYEKSLTFLPAWISYHVPSKYGMKLHVHSQTSTASPLKFGNGCVI